jgi:hypothetical protein
MPKHQEPKKDGTNTEMPRGVVSKLRSVGIRMGKPRYQEWYLLLFVKRSRGNEGN